MNSTKTRILTEGAVMTALATVLSLVKVFEFPWGGSITLLSMLPIIIFGVKHGVKEGLAVSFLYSVIQLGLGITLSGLLGWGLTPAALAACILVDYILAFSVLGLAGMLRSKGFKGQIAGAATAIALRFICHVASGIFIFASCGLLWDGFSTENIPLYSVLYNGAYMLPELVFTLIAAAILFKLPQTRKLISET